MLAPWRRSAPSARSAPPVTRTPPRRPPTSQTPSTAPATSSASAAAASGWRWPHPLKSSKRNFASFHNIRIIYAVSRWLPVRHCGQLLQLSRAGGLRRQTLWGRGPLPSNHNINYNSHNKYNHYHNYHNHKNNRYVEIILCVTFVLFIELIACPISNSSCALTLMAVPPMPQAKKLQNLPHLLPFK